MAATDKLVDVIVNSDSFLDKLMNFNSFIISKGLTLSLGQPFTLKIHPLWGRHHPYGNESSYRLNDDLADTNDRLH